MFSDGDCGLRPDHVAAHLELRAPSRAVLGDCYRLSAAASNQVDESIIDEAGLMESLLSPDEIRRMRWKAARARWYEFLQIPMRPRLTGNNFSLFRRDFERVNGFDENFVGWGLEDTDLQRRLQTIGIRFRSILHRSLSFHLWHPVHPTHRRRNWGTRNHAYYERSNYPAKCRKGLQEEAA